MLAILAMHLGIALGAAKNVLLDALLVCVKSILGCDDVEAMATLGDATATLKVTSTTRRR